MDSLLLYGFDLEGVHLHVKDLAEVHDNRLVDFLPQVRPKNLDQRYFEGWNLTVHENSRQVKLNLETNVDVRAIYRRRPPECKSSVWNLIEARTLRVSELLVLHRFFKTASLLPK